MKKEDVIRQVIEGKSVVIYPAGKEGAPSIYLNSFNDNSREIYNALGEITEKDVSLISISTLDWNRDMTPWPFSPSIKGMDSFLGGADEYLDLLTSKIIPEVEKEIGTPSVRAISGYSLGGLFAIYSLFRTDLFSFSASISGSLWYPSFKEFVCSSPLLRSLEGVYFSLGDRERLTGNPYLNTVEESTIQIFRYFKDNGVNTIFESNKGNHYKNAVKRTVKGLNWIIENS